MCVFINLYQYLFCFFHHLSLKKIIFTVLAKYFNLTKNYVFIRQHHDMAFITLIETELDEILKATLSLREDRSLNISCSQIPDEEDKRPSRHHYLDISAGSIRKLFFTLDSVC